MSLMDYMIGKLNVDEEEFICKLRQILSLQ